MTTKDNLQFVVVNLAISYKYAVRFHVFIAMAITVYLVAVMIVAIMVVAVIVCGRHGIGRCLLLVC